MMVFPELLKNYDLVSIATLASAIGACVSALATLFTVREIRKQREASYKPDVSLSALSFSGTCGQDFVCNPFDVKIWLDNFGLGTAKQVTINIHTNIESLLGEVNALLKETGIPYHLAIPQNMEFIITHQQENGEQSTGVSVEHSVYFLYIKPEKDNYISFSVPLYIVYFLDFLLHMSFMHGINEAKSILKKFSIHFDIDYSDIGDKKYHKKQELHFFDCHYDHESRNYGIMYK